MKKFKKTKACTAVLLLAALLTVEILYPLNMHDLFQQPNVVEAKETESAVDGSEGIKLVPDEDVDTADIVADGIDYEAIKEEIKEPEYREAVTYYDNRIAVIREEGEGTAKLEDTDWYQNNGATGYDVIASNNKVVDGKTVAETSYVVTINSEDVWDAVDNINTTGEVLIAEPDYIYSTAVEGNASEAPDTANDPGFEKEWYMNKLNTPSIWSDNETYGNTSGEGVVIAVIDTGVDYTHEDLKDNMWMNSAELFGNDGIDDDGNGYVDDYYGVSFISGKSDPMDDNGHGTHVAGIIAMEDNETGGVGIAYKSQIMAIKAGGSDGSFNSSDIAKAINYAVKNGADVINMSFGSYAHSAIMETALQTAFSRCVLVAAAGNDGMPTLDAVGYIFKGNMYPASYSYVIGVMASTQNNTLASFSNWDYKNNSGAEYEITAPGSEIYSTLPGNRYASWSGTSMAAPMVSAAAAIIRSSHSDKNTYSSRYIMGQLVSASTSSLTYVDTYGVPHIYSSLNVGDSLTKSPKPNINIDEVYIFDSPELSDKNNGDGVIQPGETVNIAIGVRNQWGAATDCYVSVDANSTGGVANPYVTFVNGKEVKIDDVGTFGTQNNGYIYNDEGTIVGVKNPIQIKISEDAPNDANIRLYVNYRAKNALDSKDTTVYTIEDAQRPSYTFRVQRGQTLSGKIESNMTLTKDNYYIVDNSLLIPKGVTVNVEPGTNIQFWSEDSNGVYADENIVYVKVEGVLNLNGSADEPIELFPGKGFESYRVEIQTDLSKSSSKVNMNYVNIINPYITADEGNHLNITQDYDSVDYRFLNDGYVLTGGGSSYLEFAKLSNSKVSNLRTNPYSPSPSLVQGGYDTVLFNDCYINGYMSKFTNCTFLGNQGRTEDAYSGALTYKTSILSNVGDRYTIPQYESSSVYTCNGKKYVIYKMSQYYRENNTFYDNIMILKDAIAKNGGCISSPEMPMNDNLANVLFSAVDEFDDENSITITTGYYYDFDTQKVVTASGEPVTGDAANCGISANLPLSCLTVGSPKNWYVGCAGNWQNAYVLAEYPTSVSDYQVINPVFGINDIDTSGDTAFTNNAILNRLTSKNVDDWMRITSSYDNTTVFNAKGNYYGTTDSKLISKIVRDFDTNISLADYIIDPILDKVSETTYPCVSDIYIKNSNGEVTDTVGNGTMEVHVLFNRDMDVTVSPEVTYGPDDPYSDYVVDGSFINTREWVGTVNVKVLINQGQQFFRVKDAVAADDEWLTTGTDWGRFNFYIEATGAEALTLQGEGLENEIKLSWTQDEYDTMAGYNVYRSETYDKTAEEPLKAFTKINNSLISADDKEYADTLVKPGKTYYYYFTVVDTDMTESRPSNVFQCAAIDNVAPVIKANIASTATYGINLTINANVTDNIQVNRATLYYRMYGSTDYKSVDMENSNGATYAAVIAARELKVGTLEYYIEASDGVSLSYLGSAATPKTVEVETSAKIISVGNNSGNAGKEMVSTINGVNLTDDIEVYIDGNKIPSTYVSDKEIQIKYTPEYLGVKKVELKQNGELISSLNNALTIKDDSINVNYAESAVGTINSTQYIGLLTNFKGKIESLEIETTSESQYYAQSIYYTLTDITDYVGSSRVQTATYSGNQYVKGGRLANMCVYNAHNTVMPQILSIKINGIQVDISTLDETNVSFYTSDTYKPVEKVDVTLSKTGIAVGDTFTATYKINPTNACVSTAYANYSNNLVMNDDGTFTAIGSGSAWIEYYANSVCGTAYMDITPLDVTEIVAEKYNYSGIVGQEITINVTANPIESDKNLDWCYYGDANVDIISTSNNGRTAVIKLLSAGTNKIEVSAGNVKQSFNVVIKTNAAYVDITEEITTLKPEQSKTIAAEIKNNNDAELKLLWTSSNANVAKVDANGKVTAVGKGFAIITATVEGSTQSDTIMVLVGTDSMSYIMGDLNMDGKVTSADAMLALKLILDTKCNDAIMKIADVNSDGYITSSDAMLILQFATGKITSFN